MPNFIPEPEVPQSSWASTPLNNVIGFDIPGDGDNRFLSLDEDSWVVYALYTSEPFPAPMGYPIHFPTSTDCLLWMRWIVLPSFAGTDDALTDEAFLEEELTGDKIVLEDDLKEFADEIDHAPENSSSGEILTKLTPELTALCKSYGLYIGFIGTVHEFLSRTGDVTGWRRAIENDDITCSEGTWEMSEMSWDLIREYIYDEDHEIIALFDEDETDN